MKLITSLVLLVILNSAVLSQQASDYFPQQPGFLWKYEVVPLDSANNPLTELTTFRIDSFNITAAYQGRTANINTSKNGPLQTILLQPFTDSLFFSFEGNNGYEYLSFNNIEPFLMGLDSIELDPNFSFVEFFNSLRNWYDVYRFNSNINSAYTLISIDTLISVYNIRFEFETTRLQDETISTVLGDLNCKKFLSEWTISYLLGPFPVELINLPDTIWIAENNWIVQDIIPGQYIDLTLLGIDPFTLPGRRMTLTDQITSVNPDEQLLNSFVLSQNYPNPFNPSTIISYQLAAGSNVEVKIFDVLGNEIGTLVSEFKTAGRYEIEFNAAGLTSGVYFYKIITDSFIETKKMVLIR